MSDADVEPEPCQGCGTPIHPGFGWCPPCDRAHTSKVYVSLSGCDDSTDFTMQLTVAEVAFLHRVAAEAEAAGAGGCRPSLIADHDKPPYWDGDDETGTP